MSQTHPVEQDIEALVVFESETASQEYKVGRYGVTRIEACAKGGETFDTLTIIPSIGLDLHWHGTITNGVLAP